MSNMNSLTTCSFGTFGASGVLFVRHVEKSLYATYELRSCQERRVMTILRPPGGAKIQETLVPANPRAHANFSFVIVNRVFEKGFGNLF